VVQFACEQNFEHEQAEYENGVEKSVVAFLIGPIGLACVVLHQMARVSRHYHG
jgi:hypothetical protein